jgi:pimeloyl-ACP methyl ester carboxylesterase
MASCLRTPHLQIVIHNSGHATHIENPQDTGAAILDFFPTLTQNHS